VASVVSDQRSKLASDLTAGFIVFFVALPLCLGVALASGAPLIAGLLAGIVGGVVVGAISGSHTSVSGPSPAPAAIIAAQIAAFGYPTFLMIVVVAGLMQSALGMVRAGFISRFFPSSVVKGLLAAVGLLLIFKQIPHLVGHDAIPEGDMAFHQANQSNTFSELVHLLGHVASGPAVIGITSIALLLLLPRIAAVKSLGVPAPLLVVLAGVALSAMFQRLGGFWSLESSNLVQVPVGSPRDLLDLLQFPDFSQWANPTIYAAALTLTAVASLETLLSLEAVDKLDPARRKSPASQELVAQGIGNVISGFLGGLPIASAIVRSSVNINAGCQTKWATIFHGTLLLVSIIFLPHLLNMIPLSCLAAILIVTGVRLASPAMIAGIWQGGRYQFIPFALTVAAILFTDLLTGILVGLTVSFGFILNSNYRRPIRRVLERHLGGDVLRIELANQVSFLNRAALLNVLETAPRGGHVLIDASETDYIDPDVLDLLRDFIDKTAPAHGVEVSLNGFRTKYQLRDRVQYADYSTRELQSALTPDRVLEILREGNTRFLAGQRLSRNLGRQVNATAAGQHPLAVILSCIDSRSPAELIFDLGVGDVFNVRIAGNITSRKVLGSIEYACAVAGAKLILVMGHTECGAIKAALDSLQVPQVTSKQPLCDHVHFIVDDIRKSIDRSVTPLDANDIAVRNVERVLRAIKEESTTIATLLESGQVGLTGALYDVNSGRTEFLERGPA
jgi:carbonic anhydrase